MNAIFIKDGRVVEVLVFASEKIELAETIKNEQNWDDFVFTTESPAKFSEYNGKKFTSPSRDYLFSIGILSVLDETNEAETL